MKTKDYIDLARKHTATGSDYAVAKLLHISEDAVNQYRRGSRVMDNNTAAKLAALLQRDFEELVAAAGMERAKNPKDRAMWKERLRICEGARRRTRSDDPRGVDPSAWRYRKDLDARFGTGSEVGVGMDRRDH